MGDPYDDLPLADRRRSRRPAIRYMLGVAAVATCCACSLLLGIGDLPGSAPADSSVGDDGNVDGAPETDGAAPVDGGADADPCALHDVSKFAPYPAGAIHTNVCTPSQVQEFLQDCYITPQNCGNYPMDAQACELCIGQPTQASAANWTLEVTSGAAAVFAAPNYAGCVAIRVNGGNPPTTFDDCGGSLLALEECVLAAVGQCNDPNRAITNMATAENGVCAQWRDGVFTHCDAGDGTYGACLRSVVPWPPPSLFDGREAGVDATAAVIADLAAAFCSTP